MPGHLCCRNNITHAAKGNKLKDMLSKYSWSQYIMVMFTLTIVYYVFICAIYYRKEIKDILSGKTKFFRPGAPAEDTGEEMLDDERYDELQQVVADLKSHVLVPAGKDANPVHLLVQLQNRLANYNGLEIPAFRVAVNNFILDEAKEICGVVYSEQELEAAWKTLPR